MSVVFAASGMGSGAVYHVMIDGPHPRVATLKVEVPACGSTEILPVSCRADGVRVDQRCAADGCYERWPATPADIAFHQAVRSPYGRRAADVHRASR